MKHNISIILFKLPEKPLPIELPHFTDQDAVILPLPRKAQLDLLVDSFLERKSQKLIDYAEDLDCISLMINLGIQSFA